MYLTLAEIWSRNIGVANVNKERQFNVCYYSKITSKASRLNLNEFVYCLSLLCLEHQAYHAT